MKQQLALLTLIALCQAQTADPEHEMLSGSARRLRKSTDLEQVARIAAENQYKSPLTGLVQRSSNFEELKSAEPRQLAGLGNEGVFETGVPPAYYPHVTDAKRIANLERPIFSPPPFYTSPPAVGLAGPSWSRAVAGPTQEGQRVANEALQGFLGQRAPRSAGNLGPSSWVTATGQSPTTDMLVQQALGPNSKIASEYLNSALNAKLAKADMLMQNYSAQNEDQGVRGKKQIPYMSEDDYVQTVERISRADARNRRDQEDYARQLDRQVERETGKRGVRTRSYSLNGDDVPEFVRDILSNQFKF